MNLQQLSDIYRFYSHLRLAVRNIEKQTRSNDEQQVKAMIVAWLEEQQKRREFGNSTRQETAHVLDELQRSGLSQFNRRIKNMEQNVHLILLQLEAGASLQRRMATAPQGYPQNRGIIQ